MGQTALMGWLADAGLRNLALEEIVDGFSRRLNDLGVPVARVFVGMNTLHPMMRARSLIWDRAAGLNAHFEFGHVDIDALMRRLGVRLEGGVARFDDAAPLAPVRDAIVPPVPPRTPR